MERDASMTAGEGQLVKEPLDESWSEMGPDSTQGGNDTKMLHSPTSLFLVLFILTFPVYLFTFHPHHSIILVLCQGLALTFSYVSYIGYRRIDNI